MPTATATIKPIDPTFGAIEQHRLSFSVERRRDRPALLAGCLRLPSRRCGA